MTLPIQPRDKDNSPTNICGRCNLCLVDHIYYHCLPARTLKGEILDSSKHDLSKIDYLFVGEAPGGIENKTGIAFSGQAGDKLQVILDRFVDGFNLDPDSVAITNSVRCQPTDNRKPKMVEKRACRPYLDEEIKAIQPKLIIALGTHAISALKDSSQGNSISANRLQPFNYYIEGKEYLCTATYHPAAPLYDPALQSELLRDLHWILIKEGWKTEEKKYSDIKVYKIQNKKTLKAVYSKVDQYKYIGLDIETIGFTSKITYIGLSFPEEDPYTSYVIPIYGGVNGTPWSGQGYLVPNKIITALNEKILHNPNKIVITQYGHFDLSRINRAKFSCNQGNNRKEIPNESLIKCLVDDSSTRDFMLDENATKRSLDFLALKYTDLKPWKEGVDTQDLSERNAPRLIRYNGIDAAAPYLCIKGCNKQLKTHGYYSQAVIEINRRTIPFAANIAANGVTVDPKLLNSFLEERKKELIPLAEELESESKINLGSAQQRAGYLYGENSKLPAKWIPDNNLGLDLPRTETGQYVKGCFSEKTGTASTDKKVLERIDHPFVTKYLRWKALDSEVTKYEKQLLNNIGFKGAVYPDIILVKREFRGEDSGTPSARWSFKNPAMHNIPRRDDERGVGQIRKCFVSRYPDGLIYDLDFDQFELAWAGMESQDPTLCNIFCEGKDPHQDTTNEVIKLGIPNFPRQLGKRINLAGIYLVTAKGLVEKAGLTQDIADVVHPLMRERWKVLYDWENKQVAKIKRDEKICTRYGAWRRVPGAKKDWHLVLSALNFLIQCPSTGHCNQLFGWMLSNYLEGLAVPIMSKHDGLTFDLRERNLSEVIRRTELCVKKLPDLIKKIMTIELTIPYRLEAKVGKDWFDQKEVAKFCTV